MNYDPLPDAATLPPDNPTLQKRISDFILEMKEIEPDIGHIMVVYDSISCGGTVGMGSIRGVKDMHRCVKILESYTETLSSGIPTLN